MDACSRAKHDARCLAALVYTREAVPRFDLQLGQVKRPIHLCVTLASPLSWFSLCPCHAGRTSYPGRRSPTRPALAVHPAASLSSGERSRERG